MLGRKGIHHSLRQEEGNEIQSIKRGTHLTEEDNILLTVH